MNANFRLIIMLISVKFYGKVRFKKILLETLEGFSASLIMRSDGFSALLDSTGDFISKEMDAGASNGTTHHRAFFFSIEICFWERRKLFILLSRLFYSYF